MRINKFLTLLFPLSIAIIIFDKIKLPIGMNISPYRLLQMGILFLMLITILMNWNRRLNLSSPTILLLLCFLFFALISTLFAHNLIGSMLRMFQIVEFGVMAFILFFYLKMFWDIAYIEVLAQVMCSLGILSGITIITDILGWTDFSGILYEYGGYQRQIGILGEPNFAAGRLAIFLPFIMYVSFKNQKEHKMAKSLIYAIFSLVISIAIFMTGSRMGIIMMAVTFAFVAVKERKYLVKARSGAIFIILCLFLLIMSSIIWQRIDINYFVTHRVGNLYKFISTGERGETILKRLELLRFGVEMYLDNPITGLGPGGYRWELRRYVPYFHGNPSHNTFVDVLVGTGVLGFIFFIGILFQIARNIRSLRKIMPLKNLSFYFGLSFLNLLMMLFFLSHLHNRFLWGVFIPISMVIEWNINTKCRKHKKLINVEGKSE